MFTITVRYDEKRSTASQYENVTAGVLIEASHLEISQPERLLEKASDLFALARIAVRRELDSKSPSPAPPERQFDAPPAEQGNGHSQQGRHSNGNGRRFGRPADEPTPKQKALLHKLAKERSLGSESIREICERLVGQPIESLDKKAMARLLDGLISGAAA